MHEEAVLKADNDLSYRKRIYWKRHWGNDSPRTWPARDRPIANWGDTRPDKDDLIKVLMAGVDGAGAAEPTEPGGACPSYISHSWATICF